MSALLKKQVTYYPFLDVAIDVFFSIILYNAFIAFPGWNIHFFLLFFIIFVMLNYWWSARTFHELPKHYIFDFYMLSAVMFIFSIWPESLKSISNFFFMTCLFFFFDALYSLLAIFFHPEKSDERQLLFHFISGGLLAGVYFIATIFIHSLDQFTLLVLFIPYLLYFFINIKLGFFKLTFIDNNKQPY